MNKRFDAVAFMRRRRAEIDEEDKGLTWEERGQKTLRLLESNPHWRRLRSRVVVRTRRSEESSQTARP
jgi:hypothetical protein